MICVKIQAGFGNQLFQFAMGYSLSKRLGQPLVLDISFNRYHEHRHKKGIATPAMFRHCYLEHLSIDKNMLAGSPKKHMPQLIARKLGRRTIRYGGVRLPMLVEDFARCREYQGELFEGIASRGAYLEGFWQNYRYFDEVRDELIEFFTPNYEFDENVSSLMAEIKSENSVGVHIRRGDFVKLGWDQGIDFYLHGIDEFNKKYNNCRFFVFTDDKAWAKEKLGHIEELRVVEINSDLPDLDEFFLLRSCKHQLISESTFGWWAAYLNDNKDKTVIVPNKAVGELFSNNWIKI